MKRFIPINLVLMFLFAFVAQVTFAQQKFAGNGKLGNNVPEVMKRCGTDEAIQRQYQTDPAFKKMMDQREQDFQNWKKANQGNLNQMARTTTLTGPVTIPLVVHIVLPNPNIITDAAVEYFVNRLNLDFSGLNPDSANGAPFYSVRGHSLLRFCLAKRDPNGNFTTGIERRVGTVLIGGGEPQPIKSFASGGLSPWDVTKYYNVWTGNASGGLLGIAPAIGVGTAASDGVCVNYQAFANDPCITIGAFALARTAVHEIGHNFGLFHTFSGCATGADMGQLTSAGCVLPGTILGLTDDTPNLSAATSGCPSGVVASNCAGVASKQYQNYMDYTDDPCYSMFTNTQVERMHWLLENCRAGYLTSNGCLLPTGTVALDVAAAAIVSPGGSEVVGCNVVTYAVPGCPGNFTPKLQITNQGSTTATSVTVVLTVNGIAGAPNTIAVNLAYGKSTVITLPAAALVQGANTIKFDVTLVNGAADANTANNSLTTSANIAAPPALPVSYDFVPTTPFVPATWTIANPNGNNTWVRNNNGNITAGSAFIDHYNFALTGQTDDIRTPNSTVGLTDSIIVEFDLAHKNFPGFNDRLQVLFSANCGQTFTATTFDRSGATLATAGSSTANYTTPAAADWKKQRVAIATTALGGSNTIQVAFRTTSGYGNNIFLDNINILIKVDRDLALDQIIVPGTEECSGTVAPQVVVKNNGAQTATSYRVNYQVGAGPVTFITINTPLASGATATHTFPVATLPVGAGQTFTAFTSNLVTTGGSGDQSPSNDQLVKTFTVRTLFTAPFSEGFEGTAFAPAQWSLFNPNANNTWVRDAHGFNSGFSSKIDNYNFNLTGQIDDIRTAPFNVAGADSIILSFDVAHKNYPGFNDVLAVGISNNCGATFLATPYNKSGATLATAGSSTADYTNPIQSDWRRERVAIGGAALSTGNAILAFRNVNAFGNNIYIDNVNIALRYKRDLQAVAVARPNGVECVGNFTPSFTVTNGGIETITAFTANYSINGGAPVTNTFTGLSLAANATATFNLTPVTGLPIGVHTIRMYSTNLVTTGGTGDQLVVNDTVLKGFNILGTQAAPLTEGFQGATMPPANWGINNTDNNVTWTASNVGSNSTKSATVQNFNYTAAAGGVRIDELITPNLTFSGVDSVYLSFDVAALTKQYPGATALALDSLQVLISKDCGNTFTSVFNKWGEDLQTVNDPNYSNTDAFIPQTTRDWKNVKLNITAAAGTSTTGMIVIFRNKSNNDNNIYIDNINLSTVTFPARLKQQGYLLYPAPFSGSFNVQHYLPPTDLRFIEVFNSRGQLVYRKQFGNNGTGSTEKVDLSNAAAGVYTVKLGYTNKQIVERIVKTN